VDKLYIIIVTLLCFFIGILFNKKAKYAEAGYVIFFNFIHFTGKYLFPIELRRQTGAFRRKNYGTAGNVFRIFNMKYFISLKEFVLYDKRNYYQFINYANTRSHHRRWELSRLFC
jgi:hypothetical protein